MLHVKQYGRGSKSPKDVKQSRVINAVENGQIHSRAQDIPLTTKHLTKFEMLKLYSLFNRFLAIITVKSN